MDSYLKISEIMWTPNPRKLTQMDEFRNTINKRHGLDIETYQDLYQWSVDNIKNFWEIFWEFSNILTSRPYSKVLESERITEIPKWFVGSKLNYAENLLRYDDNRIALITTGEGQEDTTITFKQLKEKVTILTSAMKNAGVKKGDRVAGYLPNGSLAVEAMLATASLGAIWSCASPDFGPKGVIDRFDQIKPRMIFSVDSVTYNGKVYNHLDKLKQVVKELGNIEKVVILPFVALKKNIDIHNIQNSIFFDDFLALARKDEELEFEQVPFDHPLFIMYSSGTTGRPKCLVHSVGGTLIQHLKEHILHGDMTRNDVMLFYTTTGWMMWNWMLTSLALGSTVVLFDGSPLLPKPNILFDVVDKHRISVLGVSPKYLETIENKKVAPEETHCLASLRMILSTGAPLTAARFEYVYNKINKDVLLGSVSGGTDIISCFLGQNPTIPVRRGEIQSRNLGMAVETWDENGCIVYDTRGELVCTKPFPSMPVYLLNDEDNFKYNKAYFSKYKNVWTHGDYCIINSKTGGIIMLGRSDATLNPSGVRFGSAEIYNVVEKFTEIEDTLCVGYQKKSDSQNELVVLFVKMANGFAFTEELTTQIRLEIRSKLSPRHVPSKIIQTQDIPYTISGKKVEVVVKDILNTGKSIDHKEAYRNPDSLNYYYNVKELKNI